MVALVKYIIFPLVMMNLGSCNQHKPETASTLNYNREMPVDSLYKFHDLFTLKGVGNIGDSMQYPCVSIKKKMNSVVVTYLLSEDSFYTTVYTDSNKVFTREFEHVRGKSTILYTEYITPTKIVLVQYDMSSEKYRLASVSTFIDNKLTTHTFEELKIGLIDLNMALNFFVSKKIAHIRVTTFSTAQDSVILNTDFKSLKNPDLTEKNRVAFKFNSNSLYQWLLFKWHSYDESLIYDEMKFFELKDN